jgi:hypothetical protein
MSRADETETGNLLNQWLASMTKAKALADAAVGWWEDHDREDCHFCTPQMPLGGHRKVHDAECPVGEYVETLS